MVPQHLLQNKFGWLDSPFYLAIWVHCAFATETYFVYQLVQFMRNAVIWTKPLPSTAALLPDPGYKVIVPMRQLCLVSRHCSSSGELQTTSRSAALRQHSRQVPDVPGSSVVHGR